jgi:hypothetical protein
LVVVADKTKKTHNKNIIAIIARWASGILKLHVCRSTRPNRKLLPQSPFKVIPLAFLIW